MADVKINVSDLHKCAVKNKPVYRWDPSETTSFFKTIS